MISPSGKDTRVAEPSLNMIHVELWYDGIVTLSVLESNLSTLRPFRHPSFPILPIFQIPKRHGVIPACVNLDDIFKFEGARLPGVSPTNDFAIIQKGNVKP